MTAPGGRSVQPGLLLVDKEGDWTSHDVVAKARGILGTKKVGHAGTLDPMATGLLILGVESATKLLTYIVGANKTYLATIRLGAATITDDAEGEITQQADAAAVATITLPQIEQAIAGLRGQIMQVPSSVSAIKVNGQRAYAAVRGGNEVKLQARPVSVSKFEILGEPRLVDGFLDIDVCVDCSSGTYIRALARDLGRALGVGGHLTALRRTKIGEYSVGDSKKLSELTRENVELLPLTEAAKAIFPELPLSAQDEIDIRHGKRLACPPSVSGSVAAIDANNNLVAVLEKSGKQLKSAVVFAPQGTAE